MNKVKLNNVARYHIGGQLYLEGNTYTLKPDVARMVADITDLNGDPIFVSAEAPKVEEAPKKRGRPKKDEEKVEIAPAPEPEEEIPADAVKV